jgi:hypothetical protein
MAGTLRIELSPTQLAFVQSPAHISHLIGPMGEGKTHCGVAGLIYHAARCGINLRAAIVRDTHQNIKTSTVTSIQEILGDWVAFKDNYKKMFIRTRPSVEVDLFGIDDPASVSKLQGPEYGCIWLEEPAPIHERANAGLPKEVFDLALARCGRQKGSRPRLQITQNPGDEAHWSTDLTDGPEDYMIAEDGTVIQKLTFRIPRGENKHLTALQRAMNMAAFKDDPGKWARYVEGRVATVQMGRAVTPGYAPHIHFSQKILPVYPQLPAVRSWDGYQHPCCGIAQFNPAGQLVVHDVLAGEGIGVRELIEEQLLPLLATPKYAGKIQPARVMTGGAPPWRDVGDPSMRVPDQSTVRVSAAKVIEETLSTRFESGPTRWPNRLEPMTHALKRMVNGGLPAVVLSASAAPLHKALKGGWHYKTDNSGHVIGKTPVKNEHSHPGDMFSYLIAALMPFNVRREYQRMEKEARMARAISYGTGGPPQRRLPRAVSLGA